jgi:hypothetical protein
MKRTMEIYARCGVAICLTLILQCAAGAQSSTSVLMGQYNNSRTGANLSEATLTPSNVTAGTFGLLFTQPLDADIFAQPLYVPGLAINGAVHNTTFVATLNNSVYAFDADTAQPALWHTSLGTPVAVGTASEPTVGILSTPVIDLSSKTIFVVTFTSENRAPVYRLHALNLLTGSEITNIVVQGAVPGTGDDSQGTPCAAWNGGSVPPPCIPFKAGEVLQRTALLEGAASGTIYMGFGTLSGQEITSPYHGWIIGYEYAAGAFTQKMIFISSQSAAQAGPACSGSETGMNQCGHGAGIWMSGRGPALDATGIYVATGNGGYGGPGTGNWGESVLRLSGAGVVEDFFTPSSFLELNSADLDLCDGGAILFTSTNATAQNLLLAAGKSGFVYVMNRASLGVMTAVNAGALQTFVATTQACGDGPGSGGCYEIHNPALWNRPNGASILYVWAYGDVLRVWDFNATTNTFRLDANQGTLTALDYPGGGLAVSASGNGNGIVWAIVPTTVGSQVQGTLYAFNATNVSAPLWASTDYWFPTKFTIPTIVNGKVYVPTSASPAGASSASPAQLLVYGLCANCPQASPLTAGPQLSGAKK